MNFLLIKVQDPLVSFLPIRIWKQYFCLIKKYFLKNIQEIFFTKCEKYTSCIKNIRETYMEISCGMMLTQAASLFSTRPLCEKEKRINHALNVFYRRE